MEFKNEVQKRNPKMEFKNELQIWSLQHHVRYHKAASSGEAMHVRQIKVAGIVTRSHLDAQLMHLRQLVKPVSVSESHLKEVKDWLSCYKSETARSIY